MVFVRVLGSAGGAFVSSRSRPLEISGNEGAFSSRHSDWPEQIYQ